MTLRHRLLMVYLMVVLLSVATVGVAVFELDRSRRLFFQLQEWNGVVLEIEKLKSTWPPPGDIDPEELDLPSVLAGRFLYLARTPVYLDVARVREALNRVYLRYEAWRQMDAEARPAQAEEVAASLAGLSLTLRYELEKLNNEANQLDYRKEILLWVVMGMTLAHVVAIGWLLRWWLLKPMEQLNRQVEALARDEPPQEPLLASPREMANLAQALDRARQSLGALRQRLIEGERLSTIGQFAAQLAHNLRNPLASIRAAAQITSRHVPDDDYVRERVKEILASVDRLNGWVAGLMEVARRDATPTRIADVVPTLHRVSDALVPELTAKELSLTIAAPDTGLVCAHEPDTLEHALIAMILNAIEASPLGETIELCVEQVQRNGEPAACRISVKDKGPGLPRETPEKIFEFSYSTKQRGMGLGLALARQSLQRQGGSAHAENNPDGGATVYVELPLSSGSTESAAEIAENAE